MVCEFVIFYNIKCGESKNKQTHKEEEKRKEKQVN